jgi:hypothetical protein
MKTFHKNKNFKTIFTILLIFILSIYPIIKIYGDASKVMLILHIGDSISKIGQQYNIRTWLSLHYPNILFTSTTTNNGGVIQNWFGSFWEWFGKDSPQILLVNSCMWDRSYEDTVYRDKLYDFAKNYKAFHPQTKIVWMNGTNVNPENANYAVDSASICRKNIVAVTVFDSVYGVGGWYLVDSYKIQQDSLGDSLGFSDAVHPNSPMYRCLSRNVEKYLDTAIQEYEYATIDAVPKVAYGVCYGGPADFKTGTPTVTITSGIATFSVAQISAYMGAGAEISYNDGTEKKCYIYPAGKITKSQWRVTTAVGGIPANCTGASVSAIKHPFGSLALAFAGHTGSNYLNNTNRTAYGANVELHIVCYVEQTVYYANGAVTFNQSTGDAMHMLYVYAPIDTITECNKIMGVTSSVRDTQRFMISDINNVFLKSTVASFIEVKNIQIYQKRTTPYAARNTFSISPEVNLDYMIFTKNLIFVESPDSTGTATGDFRGFYIGVAGGATYFINNNIISSPYNLGTNTGVALRLNVAGGVVYFYNNILYGDFYRPILREGGTIYSKNNIFIGMANASSGGGATFIKDYDIYDIDEGEANGKLTTQTDDQLFVNVSPVSVLDYDLSPTSGSGALNMGEDLGVTFNGDFYHNHGSRWRPQKGRWDCGAIELRGIDNLTQKRLCFQSFNKKRRW